MEEVSVLANTVGGLEAQGEMNRLLDELFGAFEAAAVGEADPDGAGETGNVVPDRDEGP